MKTFLPAMLLMIAVSPAAAQTPPSHGAAPDDIYQNTKDLKWDKLMPDLGAGSPEITILHVDPKSGGTQLMIRSPANYHAPRHWHTANETHTVIYGTCWNYMPSKMVHEAWVGPEGNLLFITVDGPWDLFLMDGPNAKAPPAN